VDGVDYPLRDTNFPTIDPANPYELSPEEKDCLRRLFHSFVSSQKLSEHMRYLVSHGAMYLRRDDHLIFHGCVPADARGEFLPMLIDGAPRQGRALFEAVEKLFVRVMDQPMEKDLDLLWYLWSGPRSPLFGKDRIATLERDFIADKTPHQEIKDPYFALLHEACWADGQVTNWSAERTRPDLPPEYFTAEHILPWIFEEYGSLAPARETAHELAQHDWPRLYDADVLARNTVPTAATIYTEDLYVERSFAEETAAAVPNFRAWITSEFDHNGLRVDGERILTRLLDLVRGRA